MTKGSKTIKFYGTDWCGDCSRSKHILDDKNIDYDYINIDDSKKAKEFVIKINHGLAKIPTIVFPSGKILVEPTNVELTKALKNKVMTRLYPKSVHASMASWPKPKNPSQIPKKNRSFP